MNIGPASDGTIAPIFQERLTQMGDWLKVNGDAIYKTRPWRAQKDSVSGDVWYVIVNSRLMVKNLHCLITAFTRDSEVKGGSSVHYVYC